MVRCKNFSPLNCQSKFCLVICQICHIPKAKKVHSKFEWFYSYNYYFYVGGEGVWKSFVIDAISQWADKILREGGNERQDPDMPIVLLLAYTGVAANNIGTLIDLLYKMFVIFNGDLKLNLNFSFLENFSKLNVN